MILALTLFSYLSIAQLTKEQRKKVYKLSDDMALVETDLAGSTSNEPQANQLEGYRFRVVRAVGNDYVIRFLRWRKNTTLNTNFVESAGNRKYFKISFDEFSEYAEEVVPNYTFTLGTVVLPVKIRFGSRDSVMINQEIRKKRDFSFSSDVNLGLVVGGRWRVSPGFSLVFPLVGFSVGSIAADSASTSGYLNAESNLATITPYTGVIFQHDDFQIGLFTGIDFPSGKAGYNWDYRNQPWLGIGLGYSIFTAKPSRHKQ